MNTAEKSKAARDNAKAKLAVWSRASGQVLRERRAELGLTRAQLADASDTSRNHIAEYESGRVTPTLPKLSDLALALGWDTAEMMQQIEAIVFGEQAQAAE